MKCKKSLVLLMSAVMATGLLAGCGANKTDSGNTTGEETTNDETKGAGDTADAAQSSGDGVNITLLNTKGGSLVDPLVAMAEDYEEKTGVHIEIINAGDGQSPFEKISTMYSAGDPPTIAMLDETDVRSLANDKLLDISTEKWNEEVGSFAADVDGKIYGFPFCVEGKGMLYNKNVIEEKLGREFNPDEIKNLDDFTSICDELVSAGMEAPVLIMKEEWSLGSHFLQYIYETQGEGTSEDITAYIEKLKAGEVDINADPRFTAFMDTFDKLTSDYNYKKIVEGDPLGGDNVTDAIHFTEGETAFYFNGNWVWADMKEYAQESDVYGLMPYPINSAAADDYANSSLSAWASKQLVIDRERSTPEQQQAAKDFLNWLVYDEAGQDVIANQLSLISPCKNNTLAASDPVGASLKQYVDSGTVFSTAVVPSDHWSILGISMQKYLAGQIDRTQLADEIQTYWTGQK